VELSGTGGNPPLLKALSTIDWPTLSRLKRNGRLFTALGASGGGLHPVVGLTVWGLTPLRLASAAALGFVLEALVGVEELLPRGEDKLRPAVHTLQDPVPVLHRCTPPLEQGPTRNDLQKGSALRGLYRSPYRAASGSLILFVPGLFACSLASQGRFDSLLLTRFQVERMSFDFFYDIFLLHLTFEAAKRVFQGLSVLKSYFSQTINTPISD